MTCAHSTTIYPVLADISLVPVEFADAALLVQLREPAVIRGYLNKGATNEAEQREWLLRYAMRLDRRNDQYLVVRQDERKVGAFRLQGIATETESFTWGSWCMASGLHPRVPIAACLLAYEVGFANAKKERVEFQVHEENLSVLSFHRRMGAQEITRSARQLVFALDRKTYNLTRSRWRALIDRVPGPRP